MPSEEAPSILRRVASALGDRIPGRDAVKRRLKAIEDRAFAVVYDLTRVTNDGSYQAMEDAAQTTREHPPEGRSRRGLRGG